MLGGPHPRAGHVGKTIADECDLAVFPGAELFADREKVGEDLARVFVVGESVDCWNARIRGELHDIGLRVGADDRAVDHAAEHAGGDPGLEVRGVLGREERGDLEQAVQDARAALAALTPPAEPKALLALSVAASQAGNVVASISYPANASWEPTYDVVLNRGDSDSLTLRRADLSEQWRELG